MPDLQLYWKHDKLIGARNIFQKKGINLTLSALTVTDLFKYIFNLYYLWNVLLSVNIDNTYFILSSFVRNVVETATVIANLNSIRVKPLVTTVVLRSGCPPLGSQEDNPADCWESDLQ